MGSVISSPQGINEEDLNIKGKNESVDPVLEKLRHLHVVTPILKHQTTDNSLSDILLRQSSEALDPSTSAKLFSLYQEWHQVTAGKVGDIQAELGHKITGVEELSMKLLQRLNYANRVMESSAISLREVLSLQVEIVEMKHSLTETLGNYENLIQKVDALGLQNINIKPMSIGKHLPSGENDSHTNFMSPE